MEEYLTSRVLPVLTKCHEGLKRAVDELPYRVSKSLQLLKIVGFSGFPTSTISSTSSLHSSDPVRSKELKVRDTKLLGSLQLTTWRAAPLKLLEQATDPAGASPSEVQDMQADISGRASVPGGQVVAVKRQALEPLVDSWPSGHGIHCVDEDAP